MKFVVRSLCCVSAMLLAAILTADHAKAQGYVVYSPPVFAPVATAPFVTTPVVQTSYAPAGSFVAARPVLAPTTTWAPATVAVGRPVMTTPMVTTLRPAMTAPVVGPLVPIAAPSVLYAPKVYVPGRPVRNFFEALSPY